MHSTDTRDPDFRQAEVATLAYFLWQNAGKPAGTADRDWLLAEHAVETGAVNPSSQSKA
jgi:hypothetical protein